MKKILILSLLLLLVGCSEQAKDDLLESIDKEFDIENVEFELQKEEYDLNDETLLFFTDMEVKNVYNFKDIYAISYYPKAEGNNIRKNYIAFLDKEFTLLWKSEEYYTSYNPVSFEDDLIQMEYCETEDICSVGVFNRNGEKQISIDNVHITHELGTSYQRLIKEEDGYYYAFINPTKQEPGMSETYQYVKFNDTEEIVLHQFKSLFPLSAFYLEDDSFVVSYRIAGDMLYHVEHISKEGELLYRSEVQSSPYRVNVIEGGYLVHTGEILTRMTLQSEVVWSLEFDTYVRETNVSEDFISFKDNDFIYKVFDDGTMEKEALTGSPIYQYPYTPHKFIDGSYLQTKYTVEEVFTIEYVSSTHEVIWVKEFEGNSKFIVNDGYIYVSANQTEIQKINIEGTVLETYPITGRLELINRDGNFVMADMCDQANYINVIGSIGEYSFKEVTKEGEIIWSTNCMSWNGMMYELDFGYYYISTKFIGLSFCCYQPDPYEFGGTGYLIKDGILIHDFTEYYGGDYIGVIDGNLLFFMYTKDTDTKDVNKYIVEYSSELDEISRSNMIYKDQTIAISLEGRTLILHHKYLIEIIKST